MNFLNQQNIILQILVQHNSRLQHNKAKWYIENIEGIEAYNISQGRLSTQQKIDKLNQENEIRINKFNEKMTKVKLEENRQELIIIEKSMGLM